MVSSASRRWTGALVLVGALLAAACTSSDDQATSPTDASTTTAATTSTAAATTTAAPAITEDRAYYVLNPGNYGGLPTNDDSLDQLPLYDGLTPLRDNVTDADLDTYFLREDFAPVGATREEPTGRPGTTIVYDDYGVAHITGETRDDLSFGAGWVTARDRALLIDLGRGPARAAVADVPGIDAFDLVTSGRQFVPSAATEQLVTDQVEVIRETYGEEGEQILADAAAYAEGMNAYWAANNIDHVPATVNDVIAVTAFIGSIFGAGGGAEAYNAEFLSALQNRLGAEPGRQVWEDLMRTDEPEAPTSIEERFDYGTFTGGDVTGSVVIDEGSIVATDPLDPAGTAPQGLRKVDAVDSPPGIKASNWLIVSPEQSANATTMAVMGPQLGYYYPEIVMQLHLSAPGIEAQGVAVPGLAMYLLIGRTQDYAWSLTSANQDVRDVFAEQLCEPDGSAPTRESGHYLYDGECVPFEQFEAGMLDGVAVSYPTSVHGPVIGTATSQGEPVALTRKRSTFGVDGLNLGALKGMTEGQADTPESFFDVADRFGFTFNWGYVNREHIAYFASGRLPVRAAGLDRRLPTLGTGEYEWDGYLSRDEHPHAVDPPSGRLLNWNNQSAPGFMHGDDNLYGSVHRVENFDQWPEPALLTDAVGIMNRAATEDVRSSVWPVVSEVLAAGEAPSPLAAEVVSLLDDWVADDAPLMDADNDKTFDDAGPAIFSVLFPSLANGVAGPELGPLLAEGIELRGVGVDSFVDKELRTVLGQDVEDPMNVAYCGSGDLSACSADLWDIVQQVATGLAAEQGGGDPSAWRIAARRTSFSPGLIPDDFRFTNRPTFQQVIEWAPPR